MFIAKSAFMTKIWLSGLALTGDLQVMVLASYRARDSFSLPAAKRSSSLMTVVMSGLVRGRF
jgi:hypothetical protein